MAEPNTTSNRLPCRMCGVDTMPCTGRRGCRHKGTWEYYMVRDSIWERAGGGKGYLCIGCLEDAIGRPLNRTDFSDLPVNDDPLHPWNSDRLKAAMLREPPVRRIERKVVYLRTQSELVSQSGCTA